MKINELNGLSEGALWSAIKGIASGQGGRERVIQDIFIKDFMNDAITSVRNGIKGGWIDINAKSSPEVSSSDEPVKNVATAPYVGKPRKSTTPSETEKTMTAAKSFNKDVTSAQVKNADTRKQNQELLRAAQQAQLKPAFQQTATDRIAIQKAKQAGLIKEDSYDKLNAIFESIMEAEDSTQIGLSEFLNDWFRQYMQGVNWSNATGRVNQILYTIEQEYPKNFKKNLGALASLALALSKAQSPRGAPQEFRKAVKSSTQTKSELEKSIKAYAKTNPKAYNELVKSLKPVSK